MALNNSQTNDAATFNAEFLSKGDGGTVSGATTFSAALVASAGLTAQTLLKGSGIPVLPELSDNQNNEANEVEDYSEGMSFMRISDAPGTGWPNAQTATGGFNGAFVITFCMTDGYGTEKLGYQILIPYSTLNIGAWHRVSNKQTANWSAWDSLISP